MGTERRRKKRTPKTAARDLLIAKRREQAAKLRVAGWTEREIAGHLHCALGTVHSDLDAVLVATQEAGHTAMRRAKAVSLARLERAAKGLWASIETGDLDAVDRLVKLEHRIAKIYGFDAPTRQELSGPDGAPIPIEAKVSLGSKLDALRKRLAPNSGTSAGGADREPSEG